MASIYEQPPEIVGGERRLNRSGGLILVPQLLHRCRASDSCGETAAVYPLHWCCDRQLYLHIHLQDPQSDSAIGA